MGTLGSTLTGDLSGEFEEAQSNGFIGAAEMNAETRMANNHSDNNRNNEEHIAQQRRDRFRRSRNNGEPVVIVNPNDLTSMLRSELRSEIQPQSEQLKLLLEKHQSEIEQLKLHHETEKKHFEQDIQAMTTQLKTEQKNRENYKNQAAELQER